MNGGSDQRRLRRCHEVEEHGIVSTRVRPGYRARLLNISAGGALIETSHRLLPGSAVELQMEAKDGRTCVRGRVIRCSVSKVRPSSMCYRGAIAFERHLPWLQDEDGYPLPLAEHRAGRAHRADATQELL
jgi:hypothetical protein